MTYAKKYGYLLNGNLRELNSIDSKYVRTHAIKSLIILSKFLGCFEAFRKRLKDYDIKPYRQDSFDSFIRIFNSNHSDVMQWYNKAYDILRDNKRLLLRFALLTGLRKNEVIRAFNLVIRLSRENKINEYYNDQLQCLQHFRYKEFLRKTKNAFISFVDEGFIHSIARSKQVTYFALRKRLTVNKLPCRLNELRDSFGTFLLHHGLLEQEVNLLQGRIPPSIFVKHYWSPMLAELSNKTLAALVEMEKSIDG